MKQLSSQLNILDKRKGIRGGIPSKLHLFCDTFNNFEDPVVVNILHEDFL